MFNCVLGEPSKRGDEFRVSLINIPGYVALFSRGKSFLRLDFNARVIKTIN